uniref:Uncharacterized protein n=1 Tax=Rhizophora mucronata TaxID=61149 RepID=A0A2P2Q9Z8_RHIMU
MLTIDCLSSDVSSLASPCTVFLAAAAVTFFSSFNFWAILPLTSSLCFSSAPETL